MSRSFGQFQTQRDVVLQDAAGKLSLAARDALLVQAMVQRYSADSPQKLVKDVVADGTSLVPLPTEFEDGFSIVSRIEYPIGSVPPNVLLDESWQMYRSPTGLKVMFTGTTPTNGTSVRVSLTARHIDDGSTVPDADFEAVCDFAAALGFEALAAFYAQTGDPSLLADTVNYRTKSQEYLGLAKAARKRYFDHVGVTEDDKGAQSPAAASVRSIHEELGAGIDRLTHPRGGR
jgi:hypothetical protein